jgi:outer membrane protein assembly factor BamB
MMTSNLTKLGAIGLSLTMLVSCSILDPGREAREEATAVEKEGRITMVLGDERLQADPALVGVNVVLPPARTVESWAQGGGGASKAVGHINAGANFEIAWRVNAGAGSDKKSALTAPPVATSDTIFVLDSRQTVSAFDVSSGSKRWSKRLQSGNRRDGIGIGGGIAVEGDRIVVSSGFGFVAALDVASGDEIWRRKMEAPMTGAPTIKDGRVFVSSNNNEVIALQLDSGETLWSDQAIAESARVLGAPSAAAVEDIVVAPYSSGEVIAYLAANGRRLWSEALASPGQFTPISAINDIGGRPVLGGGLVFAASQSGVMAAIDGRTGNRVWQQPIGTTQAPALAGEYLFVMGVEAELAVLNAGTGQVVWVEQLEKFRNDEKKKGRITYAGPIIASGKIVIASSTGDLISFDPQTGTETGRLKLGGAVYIEPIAIQDKLVVLTDDGRLIAIR